MDVQIFKLLALLMDPKVKMKKVAAVRSSLELGHSSVALWILLSVLVIWEVPKCPITNVTIINQSLYSIICFMLASYG